MSFSRWDREKRPEVALQSGANIGTGLGSARRERTADRATSLSRPRLLTALDAVLDTRLGVIAAPPGWGKTTLISDWTRTLDAEVVRVSWIERRTHGTLSAFVAEQLSIYALDPGREIVVIVDDLLGDEVGQGIDSLLSAFPRWFHLVISMVNEPALNFARAEFAGAIRLDAEDLRFRIDEIDRLFRFAYARPLGPADTETLSSDCAGWATALNLFNQATRHDSDAVRLSRLRTHDGAPYADYLDAQIAVRLSPREIEVLQQCASLPAITARRAGQLTGIADGAGLIVRVHHAGLLDRDATVGAFRMAPIVRRHLAAGMDERDRLRTLEHAATILEREGSVSESVNALAEGQQWSGVLRLLTTYGIEAIPAGSCDWVELAPPSLAGNPAFRVAVARHHADDGRWTSARELLGQGAEDDWPVSIRRAATLLRREIDGVTLADFPAASGVLGQALVELFSGNLVAAIPALQKCAAPPEAELRTRLIAQLVLAVVDINPSSARAIGSVSDVFRSAELSNLHAIARIAHATLDLMTEPVTSARIRQATVESCDARDDGWSAAAVLSIAAVFMLHRGETDATVLDELVARFRRLGATDLEAWARSSKALVDVVSGRDGYAAETASALAVAQRSKSLGAVAIAYGALSLDSARPATQSAELSSLARQSARDAGMLGRPWTWFAPAAKVDTSPANMTIRVRQRSGVVVQCFGGFGLTLDGARLDLSDVRPQARTVLRMLALHAGNPVHRDLMASVLWGDLGTSSALHSLHVSISSLRSVLNNGPRTGAEQLLLRRGEAYFLNTDSDSDLISFDRAMGEASAARAHKDAEATAAALRHSVSLYAGDILPEDGAAEWVVGARERYRLRAAEAASSLAQLELMLGNRDAAVVAGERSIEIDPWRDESWRTIIDVHHRAGDPVSAARAKKNYTRLMASLELPV